MLKKIFLDLFLKRVDPIFILDTINNKNISSKEFLNNSIKIANFLIEKENLNRGDRIILKIEHSVIFYEVIIACILAGIVVCPISNDLKSIKIKNIKDSIKPKKIFTSIKEILYSTNCDIPKSFENFNGNQKFLMIFSSGTTSGSPKGIIHSIGNVLASAKNFSKIAKFNKKDIFYAFWPQFHMTGIFNLFFVPLISLSKIVFVEEFKVFLFKDLLINSKIYKITQLYLSPAMCSIAINLKNNLLHNFKFLSKTNIISTASILYPVTFLNFKKNFNKNIIKCYGVTELGGSLTINLKPNLKGDFNVGKFTNQTKIKCSGTSQHPSKIFIKSKFMMVDCINHKFNKTAYYNTGDIGYLKNKNIFVLGRVGDNIKKNGEFISMSEIENLVLGVNNVKNAMVIPYKDEIYGFKIRLFVEIKDNIKRYNVKKEIQLLFNNLLTKNETPDEIIFEKIIKKTSTGKNIKYFYK